MQWKAILETRGRFRKSTIKVDFLHRLSTLRCVNKLDRFFNTTQKRLLFDVSA